MLGVGHVQAAALGFLISLQWSARAFSGKAIPRVPSFLASQFLGLDVKRAYEYVTQEFYKRGISEPEESARYLVCHATGLGYRFSSFLQNQHVLLQPAAAESLAQTCEKRLLRVPVQYLLGNWDFCGLEFRCEAPILIPRPETEELVELVSAALLRSHRSNIRILDIGCGTGVIGISLLSKLKNKFGYLACTAIDINEQAVELARLNAKSLLHHNRMNESNYDCKQVSFSEFALDESNWGKYDLIVSNPPYIPTADIITLDAEVYLNEDHRALDGGNDGMKMIREIVFMAPLLLKQDSMRQIWMETLESHPSKVLSWISELSTSQTVEAELRSRNIPITLHQQIISMVSNYSSKDSRVHTDFCGKARFVQLHQLTLDNNQSFSMKYEV